MGKHAHQLEEVRQLAVQLPTETCLRLAETIAQVPVGDWLAARTRLQTSITHLPTQLLVAAVLEVWSNSGPELTPQRFADALELAAKCFEQERTAQRVELSWTGPGQVAQSLRRTDQALHQVIEAAKHSLIVVSFAVHRDAAIEAAMLAAIKRGVKIIFIAESKEESAGKISFDGIKTLGKELAEQTSFYVWPRERRLKDDKGRFGTLHIKCAVADTTSLFISSANLTGSAMKLNMELGVLVQGGQLPARVQLIFSELIKDGTLIART